MSSINLQVFQLPKADWTPEQCEDAYAAEPALGRFAIADGASESFAAGDWARRLVEGFVRQVGPWDGWLAEARRRWSAPFENQALSWFAEHKVQEGAYAALLGLDVQTDGSWQAESVGDASLFQVRRDALVRTFPMLRASDYHNRPDLICSRRKDGLDVLPLCLIGDWKAGDRLYLVTDALALWFFAMHENSELPWRTLDAIRDQEAFVKYVSWERGAGRLRNDDATLMVIDL